MPIWAALPGIIGGVGSIVGALSGKKKGTDWEAILGGAGEFLGGLTKEDAEDRARAEYKYEKKLMEDRRRMLESAGLKPRTPRYETYSALSLFDPFLKKAIVGSFGDILGQEALQKYGIDIGSVLGQIGQAPIAGGGATPPIQAGPGIPEHLAGAVGRGGGRIRPPERPERPWIREEDLLAI
ncbi:MAG: hypothetical protein JRI45_06815 [Deltaproteobacteria bacterium]|nr:hypothetical protein [Deltaproteobacteria bacterium]